MNSYISYNIDTCESIMITPNGLNPIKRPATDKELVDYLKVEIKKNHDNLRESKDTIIKQLRSEIEELAKSKEDIQIKLNEYSKDKEIQDLNSQIDELVNKLEIEEDTNYQYIDTISDLEDANKKLRKDIDDLQAEHVKSNEEEEELQIKMIFNLKHAYDSGNNELVKTRIEDLMDYYNILSLPKLDELKIE